MQTTGGGPYLTDKLDLPGARPGDLAAVADVDLRGLPWVIGVRHLVRLTS